MATEHKKQLLVCKHITIFNSCKIVVGKTPSTWPIVYYIQPLVIIRQSRLPKVNKELSKRFTLDTY